MRHARLALTMLRHRVAALLLLFFALGPAIHDGLTGFRWSHLAAVVALLSSYIVATSLNDVFDLEIDRVNHPGAKERPLVRGEATRRDMFALAGVFGVVALTGGAWTGWLGAALIVSSLLLNVVYSVPPIRISRRALAAPPALAFAYVAIPYGFGLAASGLVPDLTDVRVVAAFMVLFAGRMLLKDFRDRRGDAAFGKRTFLLAFGKPSTLVVVLACVLAGDALLLTVLPANPMLAALIESYFVAIVLELRRLHLARRPDDEQAAIARGARMGNAVILTLLGWELLAAAGAPVEEQALLAGAMAATFWFSFLYLAWRPAEAVTAYRG